MCWCCWCCFHRLFMHRVIFAILHQVEKCGIMPFFICFVAPPTCKPLLPQNRARCNDALVFHASFSIQNKWCKKNEKKKKTATLEPVGKTAAKWHMAYYYYRQSCNLTTMMPPLKTIDTEWANIILSIKLGERVWNIAKLIAMQSKTLQPILHFSLYISV